MYKFSGQQLEGEYQLMVSAREGAGPHLEKHVRLAGGEHLMSVNFALTPAGSLSGRILGPRREPLSDIAIYLIAREYRFGVLRSVYAGVARTDAAGRYDLEDIALGRAYLLLAIRRKQTLLAVSKEPDEMAQRKMILAATYLPNVPDIEAAEQIVLASGEHRTGVDIKMLESRSYCVESTLKANDTPAAVRFELAESEPANGFSDDAGFFLMPPNGATDETGHLRVCGLHRGAYTITAAQPAAGARQAPYYSQADFSIEDRDLKYFALSAQGVVNVPGVVTWYGKPPSQYPEAKVTLTLEPLTRIMFFAGEEKSLQAEAAIPGSFSMMGLVVDAYRLHLRDVPDGVYVKDVTSGGVSVLHRLLRPGAPASGSDLNILLASDGGRIRGTLVNAKGQAVPDAHVFLVSTDVIEDAELADELAVNRKRREQCGDESDGGCSAMSAAPSLLALRMMVKVWPPLLLRSRRCRRLGSRLNRLWV